ncbi:SRPBCC family protein [Rhodococcus opacus]|uniref:DUF1857 domain-containing protein n=1 Tax=Rhodococcus opacus TaxID=37919 RepID=A0A076F0R1_RHOOP|nr:SRPBCC family protein [Rhodococcus opacus]AII11017.1 hypothetical protein EP51_43785 [Rhodococcus opacus]
MIYVSHELPVNDGPTTLTRAQVWDGLVMKANNALPFVSSMTDCTVTNRISDTVFDRDIVLRGESHSERITLEEPKRVVFTRLSGPVLGVIANEILGSDRDLRLRFSFALVVSSVDPDSAEEEEYAEGMKEDYVKAVESTLEAMRRMAQESSSAS